MEISKHRASLWRDANPEPPRGRVAAPGQGDDCLFFVFLGHNFSVCFGEKVSTYSSGWP